MDLAKVFVTGVIAIGIVTAFGLHASGLSSVGQTAFKGGSQLLGTAEKG